MSSLQEQRTKRINLASSKQRLASNPSFSVWVEASAGTGKTKVLSDRVLRLLLNDTSPSRILCLTYTKAAAVEMSNRIAERLSEWAISDDTKLSVELEKLLGNKLSNTSKDLDLIAKARQLFAVLLDTPGGLKIQTIHSFCQEILKRFPLEAKISPYFEVMDERLSKEALENIKSEILKGNLSPQAKDALSWLTSETSEFQFPDIMRSISENRNLFEEYLLKHKNLDALINHTAKKLGLSLSTTPSDIKEQFWHQISSDQFALLIKALASGTDKSIQKSLNLQEAVDDQDFEHLCQILLTRQGEARQDLLQKKPLSLYPEAQNVYNSLSQDLILTLDRLKSLNLLASTKAILVLSDELLGRYQHYKRLHSKMDYNDLIILTKHLLEAPQVAEWVLYKLDGGIDHILIDEAQDTSPEQWSIIKSLTQEFFSGLGTHDKTPTVFVVGDRKQSIYSFQGADPKEFENIHRYFSERLPNFQDVNMDVSFRSTSAILDVVDTVFSTPLARSGVASNEQTISHIPSRIGDGGKVELWPLIDSDSDDKSDKIWLPPVERISGVSSSSKLARQIAETIKSKVDNHELLQSQGRPLKYRDFLILVQRRNSFVEEIVRACKNVGVNITGVDKLKLSEQISVNDLLALAKFTLLSSDDLNLACVLKSPLIALNDDDLFNLCYNRGSSTLWQRLQEDTRYQDTYILLQQILNFSRNSKPFEFFSYILNELHGRQKFIARLGFECEDALDEFINLSLSFENDHIPSLELFVDWMQQDDVEIKRNLEQNNIDAVRLMTVHGSKGLQAPIVILPDTVRVRTAKQEAGWLYDENTLFYPLGKNSYESTCQRLKEEEKSLSLEEYHRLLYVALTRAEECLCICGYKKKSTPNIESWYEICQKALKPIMSQSPNEVLIYQTEQLIPPHTKTLPSAHTVSVFDSSWINFPIKEEAPLSKPLTPSHLDEKDISAISPLSTDNTVLLYNRGRIIHKLLQMLPSCDQELRQSSLDEFLRTQAQEISDSAKSQISSEVLGLISDSRFAELFGPNSAAEVAIMGEVEGQIISGQIDRLVVTKDKVIIVDYKTNRPAAQRIDDIPQAYIKQIRAYRKLISKIYPDKPIESYILWTNTAQIMAVK